MMSFQLDEKVLEMYLKKYPYLKTLLVSGVISKKLTREVLDIDKWLMDDIYKELLLAFAIMGVGTSCFKATPQCVQYIKEKYFLK